MRKNRRGDTESRFSQFIEQAKKHATLTCSTTNKDVDAGSVMENYKYSTK